MNFSELQEAVEKQFVKITNEANHLYEMDLNKEELWDLYLDSFPEGTNEIFRERREYDCSCCKQFIKSMGNVVSIKNGTIESIWDFDIKNPVFKEVVQKLSKFVKSHNISSVHVTDIKRHGTPRNYENTGEEIIEWEHFYLEVPERLVSKDRFKTLAEVKGEHRSTKDVFLRSLKELTDESVQTTLELIAQNSLYKGKEWENVLSNFLECKKDFNKLEANKDEDLYAWEKSVQVGAVTGRIKNHSIGVLLTNISEGMELDEAVKQYEKIVAPENYKRSKPIFTKKMLSDAKKRIQELGYTESLPRRFATLNDISINNILFSNKDSAKQLADFDVFEELEKEIAIDPKKFTKIEEISISDFVKNVLPTAREVEALVENKHANNLVSLIAPKNTESDSMFKWENGFGWAYTGNITDSSMKERVKSAGGKVDGVLRFSIQWNDVEGEYDKNDLDAHCFEPQGSQYKHIYFGNKESYRTGGELDVDIINPKNNVPAVENITWSDKERMNQGEYTFFVHNYDNRGGKRGFKAEIEFDGQVYEFSYNKEVKDDEKIVVATVNLSENGEFTIEEKLPSSTSSKEVWGLQTNQFAPVSVVMNSPNHWNEQGIGNKHYFFMLKDCTSPEKPNGIFNEFLREELMNYRKVFEALGSRLSVEDDENQLSGVGFSETKRSELIVKVIGNTERVMKIKF